MYYISKCTSCEKYDFPDSGRASGICPHCGAPMHYGVTVGIKVKTPRFLWVSITAIYAGERDNREAANKDGYTEPAHFRDDVYDILGRSLGDNHMVFALITK